MDKKVQIFNKTQVILLAIALLFITDLFISFTKQSGNGEEKVIIRDTLYVTHTDTMPKEIEPEKIIGHVSVPIFSQPVKNEKPTEQADTSCINEVTVPIAQRTFSDDSTYTAYVSGPKVGDVGPQLDSIRVKERRIIETVTKKPPNKRWHLGITAGYGAGLKDGTLQPFIGVGITYNLF